MTTDLSSYPRRYCSVCHRFVKREFAPGPGGRPNAACPRCRSLERHRFLAVLLSVLEPVLGDLGTVLEIAPSRQTTPLLEGLGAQRHVRLDHVIDNRMVDVLGSLTELPMRDASVDLLVCYHVLEHIPDDRAAMAEIARVLAPGGTGLLQVPFRPGTLTDEDPSAPVEVRLERFGQADHVRYYGDDFETRLVDAGLALRRVTPRSLLGDDMCTWFNLKPDEVVWIVSRETSPVVPPPLDGEPTDLTRSLSALLGEVLRLRDEQVSLRREVRGLRARNERLADRNQRLTTADSRPLGIREAARAGASAVRRRVSAGRSRR